MTGIESVIIREIRGKKIPPFVSRRLSPTPGATACTTDTDTPTAAARLRPTSPPRAPRPASGNAACACTSAGVPPAWASSWKDLRQIAHGFAPAQARATVHGTPLLKTVAVSGGSDRLDPLMHRDWPGRWTYRARSRHTRPTRARVRLLRLSAAPSKASLRKLAPCSQETSALFSTHAPRPCKAIH